MDLKSFFKPDLRKISLMVILSIAGWFFSDSFFNLVFFFCHSCLIEGRCPLYCSLLELKNLDMFTGIFSSLVTNYLLSCVIVSVIDLMKEKFGISNLRGILWRRLKSRRPENIQRIEVIEDEEAIKEKERMLREEEERLREEKKKFYEYLNEVNKKRLKEMGYDVEKEKIRCINCKKWKSCPKSELINLIKRYGISILWRYVCENCKKP